MHWHKMLTVDPQVSYMYSFELTYRSMQILVYSCSTDQFLMQMQNLFLYQMPFCMLLNNLNISKNKEDESCSTTLVDPKTVVEPYSNPKNSPLGPQKV